MSTTYIQVSSRPSLLYRRLFITSLSTGAWLRDFLISIAVFFGLLELIAFLLAVRLNRTITKSIRDLYQATEAIDTATSPIASACSAPTSSPRSAAHSTP